MGNAITNLTKIDTNIGNPTAMANIQKLASIPRPTPTPQPGLTQQATNFFSNLAAQTGHMISYAGTRIGQAAVQTYNEFQNPGYDTAVDTGNPQRQNAGGTATPLPINAPVQGTNTNNSETNLRQPQQILGSTIPAQQGGTTGAEQIAGQGLEAVGTIGGLALGGQLNPELGIGTRFLQGAALGTGAGTPIGAGQAMEQGGNTQQVLEGAKQGAIGGAVTGGTLNAILPPVFDKLSNIINSGETPKTIKFTPEMQIAHDNLTEAQQAFEEAKIKANTATIERQQGVENAQAQVKAAQQTREQVTPQAVKGVSDIQSGVKSGERTMGATFGKAPAQIESVDPTLRYNLSQQDLADLNSIKEDRKFSLPDYLNQEKNPQPTVAGQTLDTSKMGSTQRAQIESATGQMQSETAKSLTPTQTQDLIRQINSKVYNPLTGEVDQRLIDLSNRIKSGAQSSFGHIVDQNGESIWNQAYQNFSKGMQTSDNLKTLMGVNPNKDLTDISPNKLLDKINELGKTPEGKTQLQQVADEFKQSSGVDLNKPIENVQQIADAESKLEQAQKTASQTTKSLVKNELASREEIQTRKIDIAKAQAEIDKLDKAKLTTSQKITKVVKSKGLKWADYALRFILIRELYKTLTAK